MLDIIPWDLVVRAVGLLAAFLLGVISKYPACATDFDAVAIRHVLTPATEPDDWGNDVYIVSVAYQPGGRQQTLVLVDTDSDIDSGDHADGPTRHRLTAYVEDVVDNASVQNIQHVQAYQIDPDIELTDS